ncbi:U-Asilidin(12)-Dg3a-like isoform X2 [Cotesia glomerata]|uniref:U-Asilidin(12)-Dg3a-like isoform X2 n=1 Tax=Cotesia glomerata TaxID=32391 RepID=UPI001D0279E8|nr:U-Asilidin(12)-Dg3a-like isoform X2 [Cotesia glomerata]
MAKFLVFLLLIATAVAVFSAPVEEEQIQQEPEKHLRFRRVTCDVLNRSNPGHTFCALHCLTQGCTRGWCENDVCHCRR